MRSKVAEGVAATRRAEDARLSPEERVALALALGRRDLEAYMRAHGVDRETARRALELGRRAGRRPSRVAER